jgi:hypothetical protein
LIRHGRLLLTAAAPVFPLAVAMIEPSFPTLLVTPVGAPPLLATGLFAALDAAVAVSAITVRADEENRLATLTKAKSLPQNRFAMNHRHASSPAGLDNGSGLVAGWNQLCLVLPVEWLPNTEPCRSNGRVPSISRLSDKILRSAGWWMIGQMTAPSAR